MPERDKDSVVPLEEAEAQVRAELGRGPGAHIEVPPGRVPPVSFRQAPSVGRIVHYFPSAADAVARRNDNPGPVAAIITRVWSEDEVDLTIFPAGGLPDARLGVQHSSATTEPGQRSWNWPERV